ncbi:cation-translocating P-type ATPase [Lactobacillus sp. LC28-10]|uniref:Cation-translocating P-type ATPase n=1 Tax=Secundilactobacillus angelensis TaxID=2722706 RepID=A0ABX1KY83_9LACO|nr:cation-translocating P-type ATPase [Secundilactobacillus angelensis]MCH5462564.1 cation-translocating P-type ATPase [Secundilactobacillus angelensis]NLR18245.1 cation-translocating P-type ATPase [Secundilactobacillus angelensis]
MTNAERNRQQLETVLKTNLTSGLTTAEVKRRQAEGRNVLQEEKPPTLLQKIWRHLSDVASLVLLFAVALSTYLAIWANGGWTKTVVIGSILIINVLIGMYQEHSAEKSLAALKKMNIHEVTVIRDGHSQIIDAADLVVGDVISLSGGNQIPADGRLVAATDLRIDEAVLTGESEPVKKNAEPVAKAAEIGDRVNEVFSGTGVTQGTGQMVVTAIGMETEIGSIAGMLNRTKARATPLQKRLNQLSGRLSAVAVVGGVIITILGLFFQGDTLTDALMIGVSLAVAAVPETLPIIVTISLSHGVGVMAKQHAIMRRVDAVETIGGVNVIASDKTGTLTQNQMTVTQVWSVFDSKPIVVGDEQLHDQTKTLMQLMGLATNVTRTQVNGEWVEIGDSTELAIVRWLAAEGVTRADFEQEAPRIAEDPFNSTKKTMATLHQLPDGRALLIMKGAIDHLPIEQSTSEQARTKRVHDQFAHEALRVLAVGYKYFDSIPEEPIENLEHDLIFAGLIGMIDPPRETAIAAVKQAAAAGIRTVMITGDHLETAKAIAKQIGILRSGDQVVTGAVLRNLSDQELAAQIEKISVYARVSPEDKIRIVKAWQQQGATVAMTGDGVNDAPALKAADVGVAMGITGTEVSKNASDMILTDDNFETIVAAVSTGRAVYQNILKAVEFLIGVNFAQIFLMIFAVGIGWGAPLIAEQLLLINVLADGIPGFYLSREPAESRNMKRVPISRKTSIFADGLGQRVAVRTTTFIILTLGIYSLGRFVLANNDPAIGMTMLFFTLALGSMIDIYPIKQRSPLSWQGIRHNSALNAGVVLAATVVVSTAAFPWLREAFQLSTLSLTNWLVILVAIFIPSCVLEINKRLKLLSFRRPVMLDEE